MPTNTTTTRRRRTPAGDESFLAAEQRLVELRRKGDELRAAGDRSDHPEINGPLADVETLICKTAPDTLIGMAVKLRQLVDDLEEATGCEGDQEPARQILALVERLIAPGLSTAQPPAREEASIAALVEKRFSLVAQTEQTIKGLGHDDGMSDRIVDAMTAAMNALDQGIVDRIPETLADISAQLRLFRALGTEGMTNWADERDERLYRSMTAGLAGLGGVPAKRGAAERSIVLRARNERSPTP